jgi:c-di-GMP-binding flagellar brake protein YcgR
MIPVKNTMAKTHSPERRQFVRAKRVMSIEYRLVKSAAKQLGRDKDWKLSVTYDMSAGGVSFYSEGEFKKDDILEVRIVLSGLLDIYKGYARIVRVDKKKNGVFSLIAIQFQEKHSTTRSKSSKTVKKRILV